MRFSAIYVQECDLGVPADAFPPTDIDMAGGGAPSLATGPPSAIPLLARYWADK
jgi:hypothetical protein